LRAAPPSPIVVSHIPTGDEMTTRFTRRAAAILTVLAVLAIALAPASASAADAPSGCTGSRIEHKPLRYGLGHLNVYFNSVTGKNCAATVADDAVWDWTKEMSVYLMSCTTRVAGRRCHRRTLRHDEGLFHRRAGPVQVAARGRCIYATGSISNVWASTPTEGSIRPVGSHCG
jgi:hypothetical protein